MVTWLSDAEVAYILEHGQLELADDVTWRRQGQNYKLLVALGNNQDLDLMLAATWNPRTDKFSFSLYYPRANQPLRRYCSRGVHSNPGPVREVIRGQHKHTWQAAWGDRVAYVPQDITDTRIGPALRQFLDECHVAVQVDLPDPPEPSEGQLSF